MKRKQKIVLSICGTISLSSYLQSCKATTGSSSLRDDQYGDEKGGYLQPSAEAQEAVRRLHSWIQDNRLDNYIVRVFADGDAVTLDCYDHRGAQIVQDAIETHRRLFSLSGGRWVYNMNIDADADDHKGGGYDSDKGGDSYGNGKGGSADGMVPIRLTVEGISFNPGEDSKGGGGYDDDKGGGYDDDKGGGYDDDKGGSGRGGR